MIEILNYINGELTPALSGSKLDNISPRDGKVFSIRDLDSLNGTYLEGERTAGGPLHDGSEIQIGKYRMTFYPSRHDLPAGA